MEINIPRNLGRTVHYLLHLRKPPCWKKELICGQEEICLEIAFNLTLFYLNILRFFYFYFFLERIIILTRVLTMPLFLCLKSLQSWRQNLLWVDCL